MGNGPGCRYYLTQAGIDLADAHALRRISMTLHRWHELECGDGNSHGSWAIVRGSKTRYKDAAQSAGWSLWKCDDGTMDACKNGEVAYHNLNAGRAWIEICERERIETFTHDDDDGAPYMEHHHYSHGNGKDSVSYTKIPDREAGAKRRLAAIMARYPGFRSYVQGDPRGCALYVLRPGDVREGDDVSSVYTRGIAVHK
jgi:hypothetical protein